MMRLQPDLADISLDLGDVLRDQGRLDEIVTSHHEAPRFKSVDPQVQNNLGIELSATGPADEAAASFQQVVRPQDRLSRCSQQPGEHPGEAGQARRRCGVLPAGLPAQIRLS